MRGSATQNLASPIHRREDFEMIEEKEGTVIVQNTTAVKENVFKRACRAVKKDAKKNWVIYLLVLPALAFFIVFCYFPMVGLIMAFQDFDMAKGFFGSPWADNNGLEHFIRFFNDKNFWLYFNNTLIYGLLSLVFVFPAPIVLGLMINSVKKAWYRRVILTLVYLPYFISIVVTCTIINQLTSNTGVFTELFRNLGVLKKNIGIINDPRFFRAIIVISDIWQTIGFNSIIYIAALGGIDVSLYEAAEIDGAGRFNKLWHISLPSILPTIMMLLIMKVGTMLNVGFEKLYLLKNELNEDVAYTISVFIYEKGALGTGAWSYTTAIGLFNSALSFLLLLLANWVSNKLTANGIF